MPGPPASPSSSPDGRPDGRGPANPPADPAPHPGPHPGPHPAPHPSTGAGRDTVTDLVRWAAFSCVLIPVALLWYGASLAGTAGTALGLAAVTAVCRLLLRRSERGPAGARGGRRHTGGSTPVD
jgi:hypothetical protein